MLIKLKLEPQEDKPKNSNYFNIDDNATISMLKNKLMAYVNISWEQLELRTLNKLFKNGEILKDIAKSDDCLLMLYSRTNQQSSNANQSVSSVLKFVCFIQLGSDVNAEQKKQIVERGKLQTQETPLVLPTTFDMTINVSSDSDSVTTDSSSTDEESHPNEYHKEGSHTSSDSSSSESSSIPKKRHIEYEFNKNQKRLKIETIDSSQSANFHKLNENDFKSQAKSVNNNTSLPLYKVATTECTKPEPNISTVTSTVPPMTQSYIQIFEDYYRGVADNHQHPCSFVHPYLRQFLVIVSHTVARMQQNDYEELLKWFFIQFRGTPKELLANLKFVLKSSYTLYNGMIWIACKDYTTLKWIRYQFTKCILPYKCQLLSDLYQSSKCEVVVPIVANKNIIEIFDLLEKQNAPLSTLYWCVIKCRMITSTEKNYGKLAVSQFCSNKLLTIIMDKKSKELLMNFNFTLKYSFWQLLFKFST